MAGPDASASVVPQLIARVTGSDATEIQAGDRLVEDLRMDSLEIADLFVTIEEVTGLVVTADALAGARTVGELEDAVRRLQCVAP